MQIIRREREFELDEILQLYDIIKNSNSEEILVGANLLLGNQTFAELHFNNLDMDVQDKFKTYPIYKFGEKSNKKTDIVNFNKSSRTIGG